MKYCGRRCLKRNAKQCVSHQASPGRKRLHNRKCVKHADTQGTQFRPQKKCAKVLKENLCSESN